VGMVKRLVMNWQYRSINRGEHSLISKLRQHGIDNPQNYISFFSLRNYAELSDGNIVSEEVYVHSKVLIVDDLQGNIIYNIILNFFFVWLYLIFFIS